MKGGGSCVAVVVNGGSWADVGGVLMGKAIRGGGDELITRWGGGVEYSKSKGGGCCEDDTTVGWVDTYLNLLKDKFNSLAHCLSPVTK